MAACLRREAAYHQTITHLSHKFADAFAPIALVATGPLVLVVQQSTLRQTFRDVVAAAKAPPDTFSFASSGVGGPVHMLPTPLRRPGGFRQARAPRRRGGPALLPRLRGAEAAGVPRPC